MTTVIVENEAEFHGFKFKNIVIATEDKSTSAAGMEPPADSPVDSSVTSGE
jgi:hypothetical protein